MNTKILTTTTAFLVSSTIIFLMRSEQFLQVKENTLFSIMAIIIFTMIGFLIGHLTRKRDKIQHDDATFKPNFVK